MTITETNHRLYSAYLMKYSKLRHCAQTLERLTTPESLLGAPISTPSKEINSAVHAYSRGDHASSTPQRADVRTPEKASEPATDIEVVPDTPPAVIRPGRGRGCGKYRAQQQQAPRVGMRSSSRIMEMEQREVEEAQAASARWPAQPNVTTQIETMTRQMHIREVPMNTQDELERVFPSGEEDAGMRVFPSGEEDAGMSSRQPPAAGLISRHRTHTTSLHLVLLVARGGVRPQPGTAALGLIH